jgi:hypothetical protein
VGPIEAGQDIEQPLTYLRSRREVLLDKVELGPDQRARVRQLTVQDLPDLGQGQPEPAQCDDPVQPPDVSLVVLPAPGRTAPTRPQQPDLVVVVQRPAR